MRTAMCALVFAALLLLVGNARASCLVKNESSKDVVLIPVVDVHVNILVKVGDVVEVPPKYRDCHVKNLGNGAKSDPVALVEGLVAVIVDGDVLGTVKVSVGSLVDGAIHVLANAAVLVQV